MSATARRLRPMRRWISWVRPDWRPRAASRSPRRSVEPGSIEYSAVIQPRPLPWRKRGTAGSSHTVHSTSVPPTLHSTEPSGFWVKSGSICTGRSSSDFRPSFLKMPSSTALSGRWPRVV